VQEEMSMFAVAELSISEIERAFNQGNGRALAHAGRCAIYFTEIGSLGYISALLLSPIDEAFLWAPDSVYHFNVPVARPAKRRANWINAISDSKASKKKFVQALMKAGSSMQRLPYGSVAYLGHDMGLDEHWSQLVRPLWSGWYRAYAIPATAGARESFIDRLAQWFDAVGSFGLRTASEARVGAELEGKLQDDALRDRDLFTKEPESDHARTYREEYQQIVIALKHEIANAEGGQPMQIDDLSATFQPGDCRLRLIDYGVKDERRRLSEAIGKYRAHLLKALRWPIFIEVAAAELAGQQRVGRALPAYGSEPTPYDGWEDLEAYVEDMHLSYPAFFNDPLEDLYPQ
jgi:hypothetical protein